MGSLGPGLLDLLGPLCAGPGGYGRAYWALLDCLDWPGLLGMLGMLGLVDTWNSGPPLCAGPAGLLAFHFNHFKSGLGA